MPSAFEFGSLARRALRSRAAVAAFWMLAIVARAADAPADQPEAVSGVLSPTLGRPVFVQPGDSFQVVARLPGAQEPLEISLWCPSWPRQRYRLACPAGAVDALAAGATLRVEVPPDVPPRTYDLHIQAGSQRLSAPHCVAVARVGRALRLVHLSNMNIGDPGAPQFDERLIDEINLVAPTLIVATGDYLDAAHSTAAAGWQKLLKWLTRFEAPLVLACGDHDDLELYSQYVAPSPVGLISVGRHRCLVLLDHALAPLPRDADQLRWIERTVGEPNFAGMTFVVAHAARPNLLEHWRQRNVLEQMVRAGRIGLWLAGGHRDWDGREYGELLAAAEPMLYVRTAQSSPAPREGADGVSHYRIIDVVDDRVILPAASGQSGDIGPSTPVGHLHIRLDGPNDGSQARLGFQVTNNLPYRLDRLALWLRVRKVAGQEVWCLGARLEQVVDLGMMWDCRVRFDLPDKGALRGLVGCGPQPPTPALSVEFAGPQTLRLSRRVSPEGLVYQSLTNQAPVISVRNDGSAPLAVTPLVRLDGEPIAYRPVGQEAPEAQFATGYRLRLGPGMAVSLQLDLSAVRVSPGERELQVYVDDGPVMVPFCRPLEVLVE